jgi:hypothetical protein
MPQANITELSTTTLMALTLRGTTVSGSIRPMLESVLALAELEAGAVQQAIEHEAGIDLLAR